MDYPLLNMKVRITGRLRFFGNLKHEWLLNVVHLTRESMKLDVEEYIRYYNHERLHTTLDNLTPISCEKLQIRCPVGLDQNINESREGAHF